jgi:Domain of Unknown Function with PDB structure (DUF3857)/Transglutaminase-like superfamily
MTILKTLVNFCISLLLLNSTATANEIIKGDVANYAIGPKPSWAVLPPTPTVPPQTSAAWHYKSHVNLLNASLPQKSTYVQITRAINQAAGLQEAAALEMYFDPSYQQLILHEIKIVRGAQSINMLKPESVKLLRREKNLEQSYYDGVVTASIILSGVQIGDHISYSYTLVGENPVMNARIVDSGPMAVMYAPADYLLRGVIYPASKKLEFSVPSYLTLSQQDLANNLKVNWYSAQTQKKVEITPNTVHADMLGHLLKVSDFQSWQEVSQWGEQLFNRALVADQSITDLAKRLREGKSTEAAALAAIEFVQRDIRYFGIFFGESSHKPNTASSVLSKRFGDCKDKTVLLVTLLRAMGLDAYPILVSGTYKELVADFVPSPYAFDHAIAGFELAGKTYWVDGTRLYGNGPLASRQSWQFGKGLALKADSKLLASSPDRPSDSFDMVANDHFQIDRIADGAVLTTEIRFNGEQAEKVQALLDSPAAASFKQSSFDYYNRRYPQAKELSPLQAKLDPSTGEFVLSRSLQIPDLFTFTEKNALHFEHAAWVIAQAYRLAATPNEVVNLGPLHRLKHTTQINFKEKLFAEERNLNEKTSVEDAAFKLEVAYKITSQDLRFEHSYESLQTSIDPKRYQEYATNVRNAYTKTIANIEVPSFNPDQLPELRNKLVKLDQAIKDQCAPSQTCKQAHSWINFLPPIAYKVIA